MKTTFDNLYKCMNYHFNLISYVQALMATLSTLLEKGFLYFLNCGFLHNCFTSLCFNV